jgi:hypothetical protein
VTLLGPSLLKYVGRSTIERTKGEAPELHVMKIKIKLPGGGAKFQARGPGILDGRWPRWRNLRSGKAGRGAEAFKIRGQNTQEPRENEGC